MKLGQFVKLLFKSTRKKAGKNFEAFSLRYS